MMDGPHRRHDPLSGQWVLVSPQRSNRPWLGQVDDPQPMPTLPHDPACYLCPGNRRANGTTNPDYAGVHVFDNDFAALHPDGAAAVSGAGDDLFRSHAVSGTCRVLCFSADHSRTLPQLSPSEVREVIDTWASESAALGRDHPWVQIFENKGAMMGCSNPHPHGQIWASRHIPDLPAHELANQADYFALRGRAMLADVAERELHAATRVVVATGHWLAIVPYWASWPFETLLLPRFAVQRMDAVTAEQRDDLASALRELTARYDNLFACSFPYSMGWHGAPYDGQDHPGVQLHAHFYPPLLRSASIRKFMVGYEMLAEAQRDLTPESAAALLRAVSPRHFSA